MNTPPPPPPKPPAIIQPRKVKEFKEQLLEYISNIDTKGIDLDYLIDRTRKLIIVLGSGFLSAAGEELYRKFRERLSKKNSELANVADSLFNNPNQQELEKISNKYRTMAKSVFSEDRKLLEDFVLENRILARELLDEIPGEYEYVDPLFDQDTDEDITDGFELAPPDFDIERLASWDLDDDFSNRDKRDEDKHIRMDFSDNEYR